MTHVKRLARSARQQEKVRGTARRLAVEDPQLRRMLTSRVHCGEEMQQVTVMPGEPAMEGNDGGMITYRCACGFSFDQRQD